MAVEAPSALIFGGDNFVAKNLGQLLESRGIKVFWDEDEVGRPLYFFNFVGDKSRIDEMVEKKVKICKVETNPSGLRPAPLDRGAQNGDSRIVNLHDVYGVGMSFDSWYGQAIELAARNKNLILPKYGEKFRLLAVEDATEAIMRAVIMSGTTGKIFEIAGEEIESKNIASVLIDLAKMTKTEIRENLEFKISNLENDEKYEASAKALRWKPMVSFRDGVKEVVAEAVARVDEEGRLGKKQLKIKNYELRIDEKEKNDDRYMVKAEVEEQGENLEFKISNLETKKEIEVKKEPEIMVEEEPPTQSYGEPMEEVVGKKMEGKIVEPDLFEEKVFNLPPTPPFDPPEAGRQEGRNEVKIEKIIEKPKIKINFSWGKIGMGLGVIVLIIGLVFGWYVWVVVDVAMNLEKPIKLLEEKKIDEAKKTVQKYLVLSKKVENFWSNTKLGEINKISGEVLVVEAKLCELADSMDKINGAVFEEKVIDFKTELVNISKNLLEVETEVGVVQARLVGVRKWIPGRWRPQIDSASNLISQNIDLVTKMRQLMGVLPEILGLDGKRREYLVLLQNEMELRATGGFIGSYGVLSFADGRLVSFDIKDVYEADGQLKGHVEPPGELKKYLGEAGWFMRDANWKASFPQSAKDIQWFFEKEMGRKVDGVIGVDLAVVKAMLNATGPIFVPDFKTNIDKDNLYEQAEFYSESKFFPGSVQKASFLGGMGKQLFDEISRLKTGQRWSLLMGLAQTLEKNDLQISLNNTEAAGVIGDLGWDGEVFEGKCGDKDCYGDYLYVVESNLGVNKANYFLYRSMEQKIDLKETGVERVLRINYENMAKSNSWPGGDYKNYLRIYLPKDIQVSEVTVTTGGQKQNISLNEVKMTNLYNKRELGFLVIVPITKKVVVEVKYASNFEQIKDKFMYMLYIQRQPGFGDTGMVNLVSIPSNYQPMQVTPSASVVSGKLLFNQKLDRDIKMGVEISK